MHEDITLPFASRVFRESLLKVKFMTGRARHPRRTKIPYFERHKSRQRESTRQRWSASKHL
ncbi:hypothetical protein PUN28_004447 [Cardiocondyla obscurior]|uniref:Uncharacterized protein n=1 Tax=Cardiocondyla obscurior TaxID=286306 RepID=A0AAW2GCL9_9HYME